MKDIKLAVKDVVSLIAFVVWNDLLAMTFSFHVVLVVHLYMDDVCPWMPM